jgi:spore coat protein CotH
MKRIIAASLSLIFLFGLAGFFLFHYRNRPFITRLTDKYWFFTSINKLAKITDIPFFFYQFFPSRLPAYQLFVKGQDLDQLFRSLPDPNQTRFVASFDVWVPGVFIADGENYKVKIRNRGNGAVHWANPKKSWRVKFTGGKTYRGLKTIDFIIPEDRGLVLEQLANFRAKKLGLLSPDSWMGILKINQKTHGLYYITEKIDNDFLVRRQLSGTVFGERDDLEGGWNTLIYTDSHYWATYPEDKTNPDYQYLQQLIDLLNNPKTSVAELLNLVDLDNFLAWQVHGLLMASFAQDAYHNNRLFYNHEIKKFQLIPWDTGDRHDSYEDLDRQYNPLVERLLSDSEIKNQRNQLLKSYLTDPQQKQEDLDYFNTALEAIRIPLLKDNLKFYANIKYLMDIKKYQSWMATHFDNLLRQL